MTHEPLQMNCPHLIIYRMLSRGSSVSLWLTYKKKPFTKNEEINVDMEEAFLTYGKHGQAIIIMVITTMFASLTYFLYHTEYRKSHNGITIVISLSWDTSIEVLIHVHVLMSSVVLNRGFSKLASLQFHARRA